jgi:hypothetical protein
MRAVLACVLFLFWSVVMVQANEEAPQSFADQAQYELFYDFEYQANVIERLIFECTASDDVWEVFAYATAPVTNAYGKEVLKLGFGTDPFTNQSLSSLLWQELKLNLTRSSEADGDPAHPVIMAQRDVLKLVNDHGEDIDALCDFVFWEEVGIFKATTDHLLEDARSRLDDEAFRAFSKRAEEGLPVLRKLFSANPLQIVDIQAP